MALVDSLLTAMVRADGDALVMHVGERPIVVSRSKTIDLSTHGMNLSAMVGMLGQLLSGEALALLKELGAVEHVLPPRGSDRFSVVAARSGDDIWIEIRRRREEAPDTVNEPPVVARAAVAEPVTDPPIAEPAAVSPEELLAEPQAADAATAEPGEEPAPMQAGAAAPAAAEPGIEPEFETEREPKPEPDSEPEPEHPTDALAAEAEVEKVQAETPTLEAIAGVETAPVALEDTTLAAAQAPAQVEPSTEEQAAPEAPTEMVAEEPAVAREASTVPGEVAEATETVPVLAEAAPATVPEISAMPELEVASAVSEQVEQPAESVHVDAQAEEERSVEPEIPAAPTDAESAAPTVEETPAMPVLASAGASAYPSSTITPVVPMEPVRHAGPPAGGLPPRPTLPAPPVAAVSGGENLAGVPDAAVTRTVRIEVPARAVASSRTTGIDRLLRAADAAGASELFLISQARPYVRVGGNVQPLQDEAPLLPSDIEALISDVTPEPWRDAVRRGDPAEWLIELAEVGRVRCSTFRDHRGPGANFHFAFLRAATADDLQLSADTRLLATEPDGLILVAGGAGSDAQAILAAFVDILNHQRADYIISLEPQIRVLHVNRQALVSQREVGHDAARATAAAKAALREEPDVLVIDGVASAEMAQLAIDAAAQDRLVIASIDAPSAPAAVMRLLDLVPAEQRQAARTTLARCFRGAVAQLLLRKSTGGRIAARELMSGTRGVARILAEGDLARLAEPLETPGAPGMMPLADAIVGYVRAGVVDVREAARKAPDVDTLLARLRAAGVDVSAIERWA